MGYLFEPEALHEISKKGVGLPFEEMCDVVTEALVKEYPGHVEPKREWVFSLASGSTGIMNVLHASLTEYLIFYGTPIGTEAFSGRYLLDIHDFVMSSEMWTYRQHDPGTKLVTKAGEHAVMWRGETKGFRFEPGCWALEYGRGPIPTSLPTALADSLISALDPQTVLQTFKVYGRLMVKELLLGKL